MKVPCRLVAIRAAHVAVPWLLRRSARMRGTEPLRRYDLATAVLAMPTGRLGAVTGLVALAVAATQHAERPSRVVALAAVEEVIWRAHPAATGVGTAASLVGFAWLHRPVVASRWPYHLLTGAAFEAAARVGGVRVAASLHAAHNLALTRRSTASTSVGLDQEPDHGELPTASVAWPTTAA